LFGDTITFVNDRYLAVKSADALMLLTEWREFDAPDFSILKEKMKGRILFDFRNRWLAGAANRYGFAYYGVGRQYPLQTNSFNLAEENKR
jgi:UDPglucose 6-dehydrogenase